MVKNRIRGLLDHDPDQIARHPCTGIFGQTGRARLTTLTLRDTDRRLLDEDLDLLGIEWKRRRLPAVPARIPKLMWLSPAVREESTWPALRLRPFLPRANPPHREHAIDSFDRLDNPSHMRGIHHFDDEIQHRFPILAGRNFGAADIRLAF